MLTVKCSCNVRMNHRKLYNPFARKGGGVCSPEYHATIGRPQTRTRVARVAHHGGGADGACRALGPSLCRPPCRMRQGGALCMYVYIYIYIYIYILCILYMCIYIYIYIHRERTARSVTRCSIASAVACRPSR